MAALRSSCDVASVVLGTLSVPVHFRLDAWRLVERIDRLLARDEAARTPRR
jgi:hypothetical protein